MPRNLRGPAGPPRTRAGTRRQAPAGEAPRAAAPERRLRVALLIALFALSLFAGRLFQIQGLDAEALARDAVDNRLTTKVLPASRGDITDVHGAVLATTVERVNVTVDQTIVGTYKRRSGDLQIPVGVTGAAHDIAAALHRPVAEVLPTLQGTRRFAYVAKEVSPEVWKRVKALHVPGVYPESANRRVYPGADVAASVVGFVARDGRPLAGVERALQKQLSGRDGRVTLEKGADGRQIPTGVMREVAPVPGDDVRLTLDRDVQWKAQQVLADQVSRTGAESGVVVVSDVRTGDVLALATAPTFDANDPADSPSADRGNRGLLDVFEPGSTSKVITAAAAIEEGKVTPESHFAVDASIRRGGRTFHDSHSHPREKLTLAGILAQSSNVGAVLAGERLSAERMHDYLVRFGLGQPTGVGLPESRGILAPAAQWDAAQRFTVLFGQGLAVTALQANQVFATLANDGLRAGPRIVDGVTGADGVFHAEPAPRSVRVVSPRTAQQMRRMLETVVSEEGTAQAASIPGFRVAGKTGTAQAPDSTCGCYRGYTASFIGFAPADHPVLTVSVILQRPTRGHYGGVVAAPVFQKVMGYALAQRGVQPSGSKPPRVKLTYR